MPSSTPITIAADDLVALIQAAPVAATFVDRVRRTWLPIKELSGLVPGQIHVSVIPGLMGQLTNSGRSIDRHHSALQVAVEGKLNATTQLSDAWQAECDRFAEVQHEITTLIRKTATLTHGAQLTLDVQAVYAYSPRSLRQNCWSSAWTFPITFEESRR